MLATASYEPRLVRRSRRSNDQMELIRSRLFDIVSADQPMTVRQVYYCAVSCGLIAKTEDAYKVVKRLLVEMRRGGAIPYRWLADRTRFVRRPQTFTCIEAALHHAAHSYRRSLWQELDERVEVWLEKDALAGVLIEVTNRFDVPLMVTRGYASLSFLHDAAEQIAAEGKPTTIYYFGDLDPSGVDIPVKVKRELRAFAPDIDIEIEVVAVTRQLAKDWKLPTRPTKASDSRSSSFEGDSVEVDAIPPAKLRELCRQRLEAHVSPQMLEQHEAFEASEREALAAFAGTFRRDG